MCLMAHVLFGFFRCLRYLGRACTLVDTADSPRPVRRVSFASPEKRDYVSVFHRAITRTPLHRYACRRGKPEKPSPTAREAQAIATIPLQATTPGRVWVTRSAPRSRRVFLALAPPHASACEGCGGGRAMNAAEGVSLSACSEPVTRRCRRRGRCLCSRGASAARTQEHLKNPEKPMQQSAHGRRPAKNTKTGLLLIAYPA
jgi:hypothetical protein